MRTLLRVGGVAVLATALLLVVVFFWFQSYIVHTPDGIRLDIPFLRGILDDIPDYAQDEPFPFEPPISIEPIAPIEPGETPPEIDLPPFRSVVVSGADLETMPDPNLTLEGFRADAILVALNDETGQLWWASGVDLATSYALNGEGDLAPLLDSLDPEFGRSALLFGFHNELMAQRNPPVSLDGVAGWLDPRDVTMRDYLMDLMLELARLGFDEIVLADFTFPPDYPSPADGVILDFLRDLVSALGTRDVTLSVLTREADWYDFEDEATPFFRPGLFQLADIVHRFYCVLELETIADPDRHAALMAAVQSVLGSGTHRFVPIGQGGGPEEGNWAVALS